ncbi:MAG: YebC/PmpR family DNA-binding transcriptional regulator [Candidatus Marinimicrobia bacterium]|nr:YebC/PmpR family DNA-binding transcriptional regulator [Candidatus Neomarinimicrobiota bacterium]
MAGHSKWANIRHRKGAQDAKRGKIFTKIIKEITISARISGGQVSSNPRLRKAIANAKSNNLPADKIERAIKKGTGELDGVVYEEVTYEGYGPGGIALLLNIITDNKNRTVAEIRHILSKYNGNLGESGSVSWIFNKIGQIIISSSCEDDKAFNAAIESGAEDFEINEDYYIISTKVEELMEVRDKLEELDFNIMSAEIEMIPKSLQKLERKQSDLALKLLDELEDNDDVNKLFTNFDVH